MVKSDVDVATRETGFWHNVVVVLTGTAAAQAIPILGSLVLARLFLPAEFGVFATWLGLTGVGAVAVTGRYEMALALESDGDPRRIGVVATLIVVAAVSVGYALATIGVWALWPGIGSHGLLLAAFPPTVCMLAIAQVWQCWAAADGRFRDLTAMRIAQSFATTLLQILVGVLWPTALSLATAQLVGVLIGVLMGVWKTPLMLAAPSSGVTWRRATTGFLRKHRRFPVFSLPADTINTTAAQLPLIIVNARFGAHEAGLLAIVMRALGAPVSLLAASVLDVFRRRAASSWRERGDCRGLYVHTFRILALGSSVAGVVFALFSESLFAFAFGEPWRTAGTIALWLLPMFVLRFVASPLSYMFYVAGKQQIDLVWQVALFGTVLLSLTIPVDFRATLIAYSVGYAALYVVYLMLSFRYSRGTPGS